MASLQPYYNTKIKQISIVSRYVIHINYHLLTAAKISADEPLIVYDCVNLSLTAEMKSILMNIFGTGMVTMQKQQNVYGLYAVTAATAIAHGENLHDLLFNGIVQMF